MRTTIIPTCIALLLAGCSTNDSSDGAAGTTITKADAAGTPKADWSEDFCLVNDWYGDGECDDFCPEPDPDCDTAVDCQLLTGLICTPECPASGVLPSGAPCTTGNWNASTCICEPVCPRLLMCDLVCANGLAKAPNGCSICVCNPNNAPDECGDASVDEYGYCRRGDGAFARRSCCLPDDDCAALEDLMDECLGEHAEGCKDIYDDEIAACCGGAEPSGSDYWFCDE